MGYKVLNNAYSTLASSINAVVTSLTVATGHGDRFPVIAGADYTYITLEDASSNIEILKVTARATSSDVLTIERAQDGTTARSWAAGDIVELRVIAALLDMAIAHVDDTSDAHDASAISFNNAGTSLSSSDVNAAIAELDDDLAAAASSLAAATTAVSNALSNHLSDTTDAHDASAISYGGGTGISATDVEGALDELATEKANLTGSTIEVVDDAYDATSWNNNSEVPTKNALRDKIEAMVSGQQILQSYIAGLTLSNAADADHDITIAVGGARDSSNTTDLILSAALTKQIDAAWVVGDNAGGLFTGAVSNNTTYHLFLIRRSDTGVVDAGFDTSITAANIPANYDAYRRIGSFKTDGSANLRAFTQTGKQFLYSVSIVDVDAVNPGTSAVTRTLSLPTGLVFDANISAGYYHGSTTANGMVISSLDASDQAPQVPTTAALSGFSTVTNYANAVSWTLIPVRVLTNTSAQIRSRLAVSGVSDRQGIITHGYTDISL